MRISVVMSVFNLEDYVAEAIDSILTQTYRDFEFIIINDGSTDNSLAIINSYNDSRIKLINQSNTGFSKALNTAISLAEGDLIARIDPDDIALKSRLEKQINFLNANPDYLLIGSNAELIDKNGNYLFTSKEPLSWEEIQSFLPSCPFFHSSVLFRKKAWEMAGKYPENIIHHEDKILWARMAKIGKLANLEIPLIKYRLLPNAISIEHREIKKGKELISNKLILGENVNEKELEVLQKRINISNNEKKSIYHLQLASAYFNYNFKSINIVLNLLKSIYFSPIQSLHRLTLIVKKKIR